MPEASYTDLVARLAAAQAARAAERATADAWYEAQCTAATDSIAQADARLAVADAGRATARDAVDFTDREAARLWSLLAQRMKVPNATLGPVPEADPAEEAHEHPGRLLDHARECLDEVKPARVRRPAVRVLRTLFLLLLLAGGVVAVVVLLKG